MPSFLIMNPVPLVGTRHHGSRLSPISLAPHTPTSRSTKNNETKKKHIQRHQQGSNLCGRTHMIAMLGVSIQVIRLNHSATCSLLVGPRSLRECVRLLVTILRHFLFFRSILLYYGCRAFNAVFSRTTKCLVDRDISLSFSHVQSTNGQNHWRW